MSVTRILGMAIAATFGLMVNTVFAQEGYGSLSYMDWEIERTDFDRMSSAGFRAVGGVMLDEHLGFEGHIGTGGTEDITLMTDSGPESAEAELNKILSVFARGNVPLGERFNVYGLFGYSYSRVESLAETTATSQSESGFSWGAGVEVSVVPERLYLSLDHVSYISQHDVDINATSLGLRLSFSGQ